MLSFAEAQQTMISHSRPLAGEKIALLSGRQRILAETISSPIDVPPFTKSAMDGYAVGIDDPGPDYRIVEVIAAGQIPGHALQRGQCAKIMTGAMLPGGADRVIKVELTRESNGLMTVSGHDANTNVMRQGEDLRAGSEVLARGTLLGAAEIALLASLGINRLPVFRRPRVGIITTGSELVKPGRPLPAGRIFNSNFFSLAAQLGSMAVPWLDLGTVVDDAKKIERAVADSLARCDVIILSGGVSAGDFDYVPGVLKKLGIALHFQKVAVQPGMPTVFGSRKGKYFVGLPGNPVSTYIIFEVLLKPFIYRLMGHEFRPQLVPAVMVHPFRRRQALRTAFVPVHYHHGQVEILPYHGSGHVHALTRANALLAVPAGTLEIPAGSNIDVGLL